MKIYDASGFNSSLTGSFSGSFKGTVGGHLLPESNIAYDLGSANTRWRDLYLSGSTIHLGSVKISANGDGIIDVRDRLTNTKKTFASASLAATASYIQVAGIDGIIPSSSYALTASYALNAGGGAGAGFPFSGSAVITGSLFVSGGILSGSFAGDGSGLTNLTLPQVATVSDAFYNATSKVVTHNFNSKDVIVTVYNDLDQVIFPDSITATDVNNITVTFLSARSGRIVVAKGGHIVSGSAIITENTTIVDSFTSALSKTVVHNFNTKNVTVATYLANDTLFFPKEVTTTNENIVTLTFGEPTTGRVVIQKGGHLISGSLVTETATVSDTFSNTTSTVVTHNFNTKDVLVSVYLDDDTVFIPEVIKTIDVNTVSIVLDTIPRSGRVVVAKGGHLISGSISVVESTLFEDTFTNQTQISPVHSFGTKNVMVTVYNQYDEQIIPGSVNTFSDNQVRITFDSPKSGRVVIVKGGHLVSGSYKVDYNNILNKPNLVSGSLDYSGILNKPDLVSGSGDMADLGIYGLVGLQDMFYAQMATNKPTT